MRPFAVATHMYDYWILLADILYADCLLCGAAPDRVHAEWLDRRAFVDMGVLEYVFVFVSYCDACVGFDFCSDVPLVFTRVRLGVKGLSHDTWVI